MEDEEVLALLSMHLADFGVKMYAHLSEWDRLDKLSGDWIRGGRNMPFR